MGATQDNSMKADPKSSEKTPEDYNTVELQMVGGETHQVEFVVRHPERQWLFAIKVTAVGSRFMDTNELVLNKESVASIEAENISQHHPPAEMEGHDYYSERPVWVHHTQPLEHLTIQQQWKAWRDDEQIAEFKREQDDIYGKHSP